MQSSNTIKVYYEHSGISTAEGWARVPVEPSPEQRQVLKGRIKRLLKEQDAVLVSHYYVHPDLQDLAEETGGCVADSLEMARFGHNHPAKTIVVCGVRLSLIHISEPTR